MKITDIDTVMYDSPGRKWTVVRVFTDAGITGLGEATYSNKEPVVCSAVDNMKQELIGQDPARIAVVQLLADHDPDVDAVYVLANVANRNILTCPFFLRLFAIADVSHTFRAYICS